MDAARKFVDKGQIDKAVKEYLRIVHEDPKDVRVWLKIGDLYASFMDEERVEKLGISPRTVNKHLERVFTKLGVENRASAASVALRTLIDRTSPVQVLGITNVASVAAGYKHSLFLKNDNTIWGCGYNLLGQLGDGTNVDALTPVQIIDLCQPISTGPIAPSNLTATPTNSIELNWQDNSNDEDGFYIESTQDTVGGTWTQIASVGSDITTYTHTGLTPGEDYFYRVRAYNSNGTSTFSNIAGATESVGINPLEDLSNSLNVYPNPSNGRITIELTNSSSIFDLVMTDISGKIILKQSNLPSKTEINLTYSMNGTYFIQFHTKSGIINKKITITQ